MARSVRSMSSSHQGVSFAITIDNLAEFLAAGNAMPESMKDRRYIDTVVDEAFEKADEVFNAYAIAYAQTGGIPHMFEWGTIGINRGRSNVRYPPTSEHARLWINVNEGAGLNRTLWFVFKPSLAHVPKPTRRDTGMDTEVINKMRDHVFRDKARILETGEEVTIEPNKAQWLLIPAFEWNRPYMRPHDIKRGYMLHRGPITFEAGIHSTAGEFTKIWMGFWEGRGNDIVDEHIQSTVWTDYAPEFVPRRTSATYRPVGSFSLTGMVKSKSRKKQANVIRKARRRAI